MAIEVPRAVDSRWLRAGLGAALAHEEICLALARPPKREESWTSHALMAETGYTNYMTLVSTRLPLLRERGVVAAKAAPGRRRPLIFSLTPFGRDLLLEHAQEKSIRVKLALAKMDLSVDGSPSSQAKATDVELYEHIGTHSQVEVGIAVAAGYTTINEVIDMTGFVKPTVRSNLNVLHKTNVISKSDSEDGSSKKLYTAQEPPQERILGEYLTRHAALLGQVA